MTYKTVSNGDSVFSLMDENGVKKSVVFKKGMLQTTDQKVIDLIEAVRTKQESEGVLKQNYSFLTDEEYMEMVSPESMYVTYNNRPIHVRHIRKGLKIAEKHGWKPEEDNTIVVEKSNVSKGLMTLKN